VRRHLDVQPERVQAPPEHLVLGRPRQLAVRVRRSRRIGRSARAGDGQRSLDLCVVRRELFVAERPVDRDTVGGGDAEVVGTKTHSDGREVHGGAADGATGVHTSGLDRVVAVDDPQVVPVEGCRASTTRR
jgi:hypothetical protein